MQFYIFHLCDTVFDHLIIFFCHYLALLICYKYDIFFNFCSTENMIFSSVAENQEIMIFSLSVFTIMLFFMQWGYSNIDFVDYKNNELGKKDFHSNLSKRILASHSEDNQSNLNNSNCSLPLHN